MIGLSLVFLVAGLVIAWVYGIKPTIENHISNKKIIEEFYYGKDSIK